MPLYRDALLNYSTQRRRGAGGAEESMRETGSARLNKISGVVVQSSILVHSTLGPGLLESVYEACLACELRERGLNVQRQVALPIVYKSITLEQGYRIDLLIEDAVIAEVKTVIRIHPVHEAQLLT